MQFIEIRTIQTEKERSSLFYQRWLVLRKPMGMPQGTEQDQYEESSFHVIAVCDRQIVGSARLRELSEELGSIAYVCVLPEFQSQGIGTKLVQKLIEIAQEQNLKRLRVMTRTQAFNFYQKLGFVEQNKPINFLGIPHQFMYFNLPSFEKKTS